MRIWNRICCWFRAVVRRSRMEREMDAELRFHISEHPGPSRSSESRATCTTTISGTPSGVACTRR